MIDTAATVGTEREVDRYAASLLMPRFLVDPMIAELPMSMALVDEFAGRFRVSIMAAILRLADIHTDAFHTDAFAVVVEEPGGRPWFRRSITLDPQWFVRAAGPARVRPAEMRPFRANDVADLWRPLEEAFARSGSDRGFRGAAARTDSAGVIVGASLEAVRNGALLGDATIF